MGRTGLLRYFGITADRRGKPRRRRFEIVVLVIVVAIAGRIGRRVGEAWWAQLLASLAIAAALGAVLSIATLWLDHRARRDN